MPRESRERILAVLQVPPSLLETGIAGVRYEPGTDLLPGCGIETTGRRTLVHQVAINRDVSRDAAFPQRPCHGLAIGDV